MKVRVKAEFKDKHTGEIHKIGKELELSVQRINEIIQVGNLIELVEQTEQPEQSETKEESPESDEQAADQEEKAVAGEQAEETPKQTGRRKRTK